MSVEVCAHGAPYIARCLGCEALATAPSAIADAINNPSHYMAGGIEAIEVVEAFELGFRLGNVVTYILRADRKGSRLEDLKKAKWYLDREIAKSGPK